MLVFVVCRRSNLLEKYRSLAVIGNFSPKNVFTRKLFRKICTMMKMMEQNSIIKTILIPSNKSHMKVVIMCQLIYIHTSISKANYIWSHLRCQLTLSSKFGAKTHTLAPLQRCFTSNNYFTHVLIMKVFNVWHFHPVAWPVLGTVHNRINIINNSSLFPTLLSLNYIFHLFVCSYWLFTSQ